MTMASTRADSTGQEWMAARRSDAGTAADALQAFLGHMQFEQLSDEELKKAVLHFYQGANLHYMAPAKPEHRTCPVQSKE